MGVEERLLQVPCIFVVVVVVVVAAAITKEKHAVHID
jgi:hypothetical protein